MLTLLLVWSLAAGASAPPAESANLEEILVVAARLPRPVEDVVGSVDVIDGDSLSDRIAIDAGDVVRYTPGVSVTRADTRFGATEFTIRGLSGNRVTTLIDGVPVADQFDIGSFSNAGQDYLTPEAIARVEILRGPASTLFGSDAMGGVVAVLTRDPEYYLDGRRFGSSAGMAWSGADDARRVSGAVAGRHGAWSGLFQGSRLRSDERDAAGTDAEEPLERDRRAALVKLVYELPRGDALRLTGQVFDEQVESRPEAVLGYGRQFVNTTELAGNDERRRYAVQLSYEFTPEARWAESGRLSLFAQRSRTEANTRERRERLDPPVEIRRGFDYAFDDLGVVADFDSRFALGTTQHRLGWGVSVRRSHVKERRDGWQRDLVSGATTSTLLGENLPVRDFPNSTITESAVYLHDEVFLGPVTLIPGVRFEHYRLDADADNLYREDFPDLPVEDVEEFAFAPKLGAQWQLGERSDLFAQYARGFRAPPFEDVNIGLSYLVPFPVQALPNPDLQAESSDGLEIGFAHHADRWQSRVTLFGADYDDFIESKASLGVDPQTGVLLFQSRNLERARVYGVELSVTARLSETLGLEAAGSWTRGENRESDEPLDTVDPPSVTARLHWQPNARWWAGLAVRAAAAQHRVDDSEAELFEPGGYLTLDLTGGYAPSESLAIRAGVFNLNDRRYWHWSSVRGRPADDPLVELLAAPGRYAAVSVALRL